MRTVLFACGLGLLAGCGASGTAARPGPDEEAERTRKAQLETLRQRNAEQASRLREVEGRRALAQAEVEELRASRQAREDRRRETVRIGRGEAEATGEPDEPLVDEPPPPERGDSDRPVLRLYGKRPDSKARAEPSLEAVPEVPDGLSDRLPVADLPESADAEALGTAPAPSGNAPRAERDAGGDAAVKAYRRALALVRDRKFAEAERQLGTFLERYAAHPYSDHARYWRAEALYALRGYARALESFGIVVKRRAPAGRVADALFKMGLCHKRMGRPGRARALFERVREDFPNTVAARLAAQENAS
ncbi:MAG: tetratricopeptide repeat protein [Myxococcota bacterium]